MKTMLGYIFLMPLVGGFVWIIAFIWNPLHNWQDGVFYNKNVIWQITFAMYNAINFWLSILFWGDLIFQ